MKAAPPCVVPMCPHVRPCPVHPRAGSRQSRGYDERWLRLRNWFIRQPANVICAECARRNLVELSREVDHIQPFVGLDDPRRLDVTNLQALCVACHRRKTTHEHRVVRR